ncbi:unnamed protein product [Coccothraustes coccothraustes]
MAALAPRRDYLRPPSPCPARSARRGGNALRVPAAASGASWGRPPLTGGERPRRPAGDYFPRGRVGVVGPCVMASGSGARALSVGVAPGCADHVTGRRKWRRDRAGSVRSVRAPRSLPFLPFPPDPARSGSAFPLPKSLPWLSAVPALQLPFHNPRWALRLACLVGWGRPCPE